MVEISPEDPFHTTDDVAAIFHVSKWTVRHWITEGRITATKVGRRWLVKHSEVVRFANQNHG
jgi:excisionase family DNA binding protein